MVVEQAARAALGAREQRTALPPCRPAALPPDDGDTTSLGKSHEPHESHELYERERRARGECTVTP